MQIGLLSDTHSYIDDRIIHHLSDCDYIIHAGDIGDLKVTDELKKVTKLIAVYGNIDNHLIRSEFPEIINFELGGMRFLLTHIGGYPTRYAKGIREKIMHFKPNIFICGHSHLLKVVKDNALNVLHINPGAAGFHGIHKVRTLIKFEINFGKIEKLKVVELGTKKLE